MPQVVQPNNPQYHKRLATMAELRANGETLEEIGDKVGLSKSAVCKHLNKAEAKAIIERETNRLMAALPDITANSLDQIQTAKTIHQAFKGNGSLPEIFKTTKTTGKGEQVEELDLSAALKYADMAAKRERDILQGMGILPSHAQSVVIQQIYNDNRLLALSPEILKALGGFCGSSATPSLDSGLLPAPEQGQVIEGEIIEEEGGEG